MSLPSFHILFFTLLLFSIGLYGVIARRNLIGILMSVELMLNAVNVNLIVFSSAWNTPETGQIFAIFVITLAAAAAAVGLAIVLAIYRNKRSVYADDINLMKW